MKHWSNNQIYREKLMKYGIMEWRDDNDEMEDDEIMVKIG